MTLTTHMITGAAASRLFATHPIQAFFIGWLTHYIFDSIIHWDYSIETYRSNRNDPAGTVLNIHSGLIVDFFRVGIDSIIGLLAVGLIIMPASQTPYSVVFAGAIGSVVPDFLQFVYGLFKFKILDRFQQFHHFMHADRSLKNRPLIGILSQVGIIVLIAVLFSLPL